MLVLPAGRTPPPSGPNPLAGKGLMKAELNDYLPVLNALEITQQLTRDLITARRRLLEYRVNLYRALGGSWSRELEAPPTLSEEQRVAKAED